MNAAIGLHVAPASPLTSMFTTLPVPMLCEKVMFLISPARQLTAVFGAVTVMVGLTMMKFTSLMSVMDELVAEVTRILP